MNARDRRKLRRLAARHLPAGVEPTDRHARLWRLDLALRRPMGFDSRRERHMIALILRLSGRPVAVRVGPTAMVLRFGGPHD
jgi:hypothetical protein